MDSDKYSSFRYEGLICTSYGHLDIRVSKPNAPRALRIMDALVKLVRARGHKIKMRNEKTYVQIEEEEIEICLREKYRKLPKDNWLDTTDYLPERI